MWEFQVSPEFRKSYRKLCGKNPTFRQAVDKKIHQILEDPLRYKPLRKPLQGFRRVHVQHSFVMVFEPRPELNAVRFHRLVHHDEAYGF